MSRKQKKAVREEKATRLAENILANIILLNIGAVAATAGERIKTELLAGRTITRKRAIRLIAKAFQRVK